jgi:serine/threonine protein kinase
MQESGIFKTAVKLPAHERAAYLDKACGANAALRLEVEGLLRAHGQPGEFMHRPPIADMTTTYGTGPERPGMRIGPYKLLQYLGEGGMGTVFLAEQSEPIRRMVALKIVKLGMDSSQVLARFEAERQALALMDHPNIAKVLDAGKTSEAEYEPRVGESATEPPSSGSGATPAAPPSGRGLERPYFVMELVKGVPITEFCDKNKLDTRQRLELFIAVCNAIQHAHMKGIIHRDVKPSNVLIALYDGKPVPKVIDFGVAKAMAEPLTQRTLFTQIGQIVGTFEYMSPEQATLNQLDIDTRSDIYSLGVLLYELLTGVTPLEKDRLRALAFDQMLRAIREEEPMRPSIRLNSAGGALALAAAYRGGDSQKLVGLLRGELDWIVMKCLEKERDRRFVTAGSLAQDRRLRDDPGPRSRSGAGDVQDPRNRGAGACLQLGRDAAGHHQAVPVAGGQRVRPRALMGHGDRDRSVGLP